MLMILICGIIIVLMAYTIPYCIKNKTQICKIYHYKTLHFWLVLLFSFLASFVLVGGTFFLPLNVPVFYRAKLYEFILYFFLVGMIFAHSIVSIEILKKYQWPFDSRPRNDSKKVFWQSFTLFLGIGVVIWIRYPDRISNDSIQVLRMITTNEFNTHHTVLYPVLNQILWTVSRLFTSTDLQAIAFLTFVPLVTFAITYSLWLVLLYQRGFSKSLLWIVFSLFYINPINSLQMVTLWKDIFYTQALFLLPYLFILFYTDKKYQNSLWFLIVQGMLLAFILMIRFNGVGVVLFSILLLAIHSFISRQWKILYIPILTIIFSYVLVNTVIFKALNFKDTSTVHKSSLIMNTINTAYLYGMEDTLHPDILKLTKAEGINQDIWRTARFNSITSKYWIDGDVPEFDSDIEYPKDTIDFYDVVNVMVKDNRTFLKYYLYNWTHNFGMSIRTRLNFIQTSWSIRGVHSLRTMSNKADSLTVLWNTGVITILLLFYGIYNVLTKKYLNLIILFPWITNLAVLFFVNQSTNFRYFWICNWTVLLAFFMIFIQFKKKENSYE